MAKRLLHHADSVELYFLNNLKQLLRVSQNVYKLSYSEGSYLILFLTKNCSVWTIFYLQNVSKYIISWWVNRSSLSSLKKKTEKNLCVPKYGIVCVNFKETSETVIIVHSRRLQS